MGVISFSPLAVWSICGGTGAAGAQYSRSIQSLSPRKQPYIVQGAWPANRSNSCSQLALRISHQAGLFSQLRLHECDMECCQSAVCCLASAAFLSKAQAAARVQQLYVALHISVSPMLIVHYVSTGSPGGRYCYTATAAQRCSCPHKRSSRRKQQ